MNDQVIKVVSPTYGCDPEIFLSKGGKIIGAEKVIPEEGLVSPSHSAMDYNLKDRGRKGIVLDGVQVELNPRASFCRSIVANEISAAFTTLRNHLKKLDGVTASFSQVVEVDVKELDSLSDKAKILGCAPSLNIYDSGATLGIDPASYNKRSAGGHIHVGITNGLLKAHLNHLPVLHDIFVGNTSVMMDLHPGNAERRKVYGRAGEHRLPPHGFEYRTLSNFWLRAYPLMSGVMGLSRFAVNVLANSVYSEQNGYKMTYKDAESSILKSIDVEKVRRAIDTNDQTLARENWAAVRQYFERHAKTWTTGLFPANLDAFEFFTGKIQTDGIEYWFKDDPMVHWTEKYPITTDHAAIQSGFQCGWESFLDKVVGREMATGKHV